MRIERKSVKRGEDFELPENSEILSVTPKFDGTQFDITYLYTPYVYPL